MFADPKKVRQRRLKRQLKAGASLVVAVLAGVFLACKGERGEAPPSPYGPDARKGPGAGGGAPRDASLPDASAAPSTALTASAAPSTALTAPDPSARLLPHPRAPHVDKEEHRKGMPVRDNLLE